MTLRQQLQQRLMVKHIGTSDVDQPRAGLCGHQGSTIHKLTRLGGQGRRDDDEIGILDRQM